MKLIAIVRSIERIDITGRDARGTQALWTLDLRFGAGRRGSQAASRGSALVAVGAAATAFTSRSVIASSG